ncbi:MAG: cytochrome b/b6 domain-containing protein [Acidobacteriota bacterium]
MASERRHKSEFPAEVRRFTANELAQHWVLLVTLTVLALTGLALFAGGTWLGRTLIALEGGMEARGVTHRFFAIVLMILVGWHFAYVVFTERGHRQLMEMKPHIADFRTFGALLGFYLGRRDTAPAFGRYTPMQKLQYWGAGIGSLVMILTGLVLWFHTPAMMVVPKWVLDVTVIVHGYEGLLLFALLFGWHIYIVHLSPGNFPMQTTFLNGRISIDRLRREHALEYESLFGDEPDQDAGDSREEAR